MKDYDDATAFLGQWGRFQLIVLFLILASIIPNGFVFFIVFLTDVPTHHCLIPDVNLTQDWCNAIIPTEVVDGKPELSRCSRYRLDVVRNLSAQGLIPGRDVNLTDLEQEGCVDGWSYSKDIYQSTIVSEFDLVCSDQWKNPFTSTIYFLGVIFGAFTLGQFADRFGRKPILFAALAMQAIFTLLLIFSPSWIVFCMLLFINGIGQISNYIAAFVLGTEILTGKLRVMFSSMGICLSYSIGYMLLPLIAYFLRDWRSLLLGISLPSLVYGPLWWFIPESPRWLLSQGRVKEAEAIVRKAAKINKVEAPLVIFEENSAHFEKTTARPEKKHNVLHLLMTRNIRNTTFFLGLIWFTLSTGYIGLSLNTSSLHADPFISCFLSAVVEVPAYILSWLALRYVPRQRSIICILLLAALSLYFIQLVPQSLSYLAVALEMLGKFALTTGAAFMYMYTAELYPTVLRNTATGTCATFGRVGSAISPFLLNLSVYSKFLPYIILGTMAVASAFAALFLPESFGLALPQTIEEMKTSGLKCPFMPQKEQEEKEQHENQVVLFESQL